MSAVVQADSTYAAIEKKIRRLTASPSQSALTSTDIQQYVNTFYNNDFPYGIKMDQMRSVYTFYTRPYIDRYPLDVNYNQGVRAPMYVEGIQGYFFKDRQQFYNMWPRWPTKFTIVPSSTAGNITNATQAAACQITSANHGLLTGAIVTITNVSGMTELNGNTYSITVVDANNFDLSVNSTAFTPYISGGNWSSVTNLQTFTINNVPFLSKEVVVGGVDYTGTAISVGDDGNGNLQLQVPKPVISVPVQTSSAPGMKNLNTANPGQDIVTNIGTVNYVTGVFSLSFPTPPQAGTQLTVWVSQYQPGRPYSMMFWNNEFTIRPVPKLIHKVEIETYLTPVQFMQTTDSPILNQWWQYIAIGAAIKVLEDRQDMEGIKNLAELFDRQEALVLERQGVEEINQRNATIFSSTVQGNNNWGNQPGWY